MKGLRDMGVSISCKKTGKSIDMGYGGFFNLRKKLQNLQADRLQNIMLP